MLIASLRRAGAALTAVAALGSISIVFACNSPDGVLVSPGGTGGAGTMSSAVASSSGSGGGDGVGGAGGSKPEGNAPASAWSIPFVSSGESSFLALTVDSKDQPVVAVTCNSKVDFGGLPSPSVYEYDLCIAKFDPDGKPLWTTAFTGDENEVYAADMAPIGEDTLVWGNFSHDVTIPGIAPMVVNGSDWGFFLARLDKDGVAKWARQYGASVWTYLPAIAIAVDPSGDIVVAGDFGTYIDLGQGGPGTVLSKGDCQDIYIAKISPNGDLVWSKYFGTLDGYQYLEHMTVDASGRIIITGSFSGSTDFGKGEVMAKGSYDMFVASFDGDGNTLSQNIFGLSGGEEGLRVGTDAAKNLYVAGEPGGICFDIDATQVCGQGGDDVFVAKFNEAGVVQWANTYGDDKAQRVADMAVAPDGTVRLTGYMKGTIDFGGGKLGPVMEESDVFSCWDIFVAKLDTDGKAIWSARYGDTSVDVGSCVEVDSKGNTFVGGVYDRTVDFGNGPLKVPDHQTGDMFLVKLPP